MSICVQRVEGRYAFVLIQATTTCGILLDPFGCPGFYGSGVSWWSLTWFGRWKCVHDFSAALICFN
jgi:hypothetical protein